MEFHSTVELGGKTATGIEVPADVVETLGGGKRPPVTVTIAGHTYRTTIAPMGGRFMIPLSAENRSAAGVGAGDEVDVEIALDTAPREMKAPDDLAEALRASPEAEAFFESLSFSHKRSYVDWIVAAKKDETRQRRVTQAVELLLTKRKQR
ncbi:hypothetical protein ASE12_02655 [Aeromicrobium sp. Root236]|uniref:YdeI/OmpD-associated family protein n=1 Tax=Aeromicrobium sp. Root236 TaxID=1736498 RepID=UPI0006F75E63|nr:YdeI/OmpD-associated family protein [Aeromicrobium sp. Root236]KRC63761.1 hypothetical protein ASE12_02655 [Aeromicrobium sp. Root236]